MYPVSILDNPCQTLCFKDQQFSPFKCRDIPRCQHCSKDRLLCSIRYLDNPCFPLSSKDKLTLSVRSLAYTYNSHVLFLCPVHFLDWPCLRISQCALSHVMIDIAIHPHLRISNCVQYCLGLLLTLNS